MSFFDVRRVESKKPTSDTNFIDINVGFMFSYDGELWIKTKTCAESGQNADFNAIYFGSILQRNLLSKRSKLKSSGPSGTVKIH